MNQKNRNRYDIIKDILNVCKNGARKSHIVYRANLNFTIVMGYLETLLAKGLLIIEKNTWYYTTDKGLARYNDLDAITSYLR